MYVSSQIRCCRDVQLSKTNALWKWLGQPNCDKSERTVSTEEQVSNASFALKSDLILYLMPKYTDVIVAVPLNKVANVKKKEIPL